MILKKDKSQVGYSRGKPAAHCGVCAHFRKDKDADGYGHGPSGRCELVKGVIYAAMWCQLFKRAA